MLEKRWQNFGAGKILPKETDISNRQKINGNLTTDYEQ
jgi:hypothetical protein